MTASSWWTGDAPDPEAPYNPLIVQDMTEQLLGVPVSELWRLFDATAGHRDHELNAAVGLAVLDLNERLQRAGFDATDGRRRDLAARVAELERLTG